MRPIGSDNFVRIREASDHRKLNPPVVKIGAELMEVEDLGPLKGDDLILAITARHIHKQLLRKSFMDGMAQRNQELDRHSRWRVHFGVVRHYLSFLWEAVCGRGDAYTKDSDW
jgi:hypothetical protein